MKVMDHTFLYRLSIYALPSFDPPYYYYQHCWSEIDPFGVPQGWEAGLVSAVRFQDRITKALET